MLYLCIIMLYLNIIIILYLCAQLASWWLSYAYLEYRDPAPIYVNPAIILPGDVHTNDKDFIRYLNLMCLVVFFDLISVLFFGFC